MISAAFLNTIVALAASAVVLISLWTMVNLYFMELSRLRVMCAIFGLCEDSQRVQAQVLTLAAIRVGLFWCVISGVVIWSEYSNVVALVCVMFGHLVATMFARVRIAMLVRYHSDDFRPAARTA